MAHLVAVIVLLSPVDPPDWLLELPGVFPAIVQLADAEEIREVWDDERCKPKTVKEWKSRYREARDYPRLFDGQRFCLHTEACDEVILWGRKYQEWLAGQAGIAPTRGERFLWSMRVEEMEFRVDAWRYLGVGCDRDYSVMTRREYLSRLRSAIGPERFYSGYMIPIAPAEWFRIIND